MNREMIRAAVRSQSQISEGIFDLQLLAPALARSARCGQFVSLYSRDSAHLLPRPISICGADPDSGLVRLVYRVAGYGTAEFSRLQAGDTIRVLGPLGNGFRIDPDKRRPLLVGGGIGIPPLLFLAGQIREQTGTAPEAVLGYRTRDTFLTGEFEAVCGRVRIATDDGSLGTKGTVLDVIREDAAGTDVVYACGPTPMLKALKSYAWERGLACFLSLEEKMACGIGACLACVCRTAGTDEHTHVNNARICREGPVFAAEDIEL